MNYKNISINSECSFPCSDFAFNLIREAIDLSLVDEKTTIYLEKVNFLLEQEYQVEYSNGNLNICYTFEDGYFYALIDIANQIKLYKTLKTFNTGKITACIKNRGIKFNIPLDARSPSYSDEADSAQKNIENMWDFDFWKIFIDELAKNKFNAVSLWSLAPFSSLVKVEDYPLASLNDVKKTTKPIVSTTEGLGMSNKTILESLVTVKKISIEEKIEFWQKVMDYAKTRCIYFYVFTWNLFDFGTEGNPYGIDDDLDNPVSKDYFTKATETLFRTYPLLKGFGITAGERMSRDRNIPKDIAWLRDTYGKAIENVIAENPNRKIKLIHRLQYTNIQTILDAYEDFKGEFNVSLKYSQAHMYAAEKPVFVLGTIDALPEHINYWLTVRDDDYYMFRNGDPNFARAYINNMPQTNQEGFFMGPDGFTWGREYISKNPEFYGKLVFEKMWYNLAIWGKSAFSPDTEDDYFVKLLASHFGEIVSNDLYKAWQISSSIFSDFQQTHWKALDYQWNPETCCHYVEKERAVWFGDINDFMECDSEVGTDRISVKNYCENIANNRENIGTNPLVVAKRLQEKSKTSNEIIMKFNNADFSNEFKQTISDIKSMNLIGLYYGLKLEAAIELKLSRLTNDKDRKNKAVLLLEQCQDVWSEYCEMVLANYTPQYLTRYKQVIDVSRFKVNTKYDILFAKE